MSSRGTPRLQSHRQRKSAEVWTSGFRDMLPDRQAYRHGDRNTLLLSTSSEGPIQDYDKEAPFKRHSIPLKGLYFLALSSRVANSQSSPILRSLGLRIGHDRGHRPCAGVVARKRSSGYHFGKNFEISDATSCFLWCFQQTSAENHHW